MNKVQRTPVSHRKKIILPGMQVSPSARGEGLKRGKTQLMSNIHVNALPVNAALDPQDAAEPEGDHEIYKESRKHRNLKQIIKHNKHLNVSSFNSQKKSLEDDLSDN